ncbi:MAG: response regulator [Desulfobacterales bacterium]|nr:response regulator [Desulfobacterales bacterium]
METIQPDGWRILLIDDEADIREVISLTLQDAGYQVTTANDGQAGLDLLEEVAPQIVVTDIRMPRLDGLEVLEKIKQTGSDIEVIVVTAFGEMDLAIRALQLDASDFITKPINDESLHLALKRARERYTARKQVRDYTTLLEKQNADQAQILHQDKMMSLGRLAASVVHEINNPLSGILNYLRLMVRVLNRGPLDTTHQAKFEGYLELVESETERCSRIVSSLLTFSRKSAPSFGPVDMADLIDRSLILSKHKLTLSDIAVTHFVEIDLPPVQGDFNQLQQCLINLIFNAIDAMPQGGTLDLSVRLNADDHGVVVAVKDSGVGIPKADQSHIFEPFFTTKDEGYGVGLGLSTVYGILENHKSTIAVESTPGQGTTFLIKLPSVETG